MSNKAIIVTSRGDVEKSIPAGGGGIMGLPLFYRREQLDGFSDEQLEKEFIVAELVPTGQKVRDFLK